MATYTYIAKEIKSSTCDKVDNPSSTTFASANVRCYIQGSNSWVYRTFLQYDLSGIPENATVLSANMYVYCFYHNDNGASGTTNIARVTSEWSEETCCWNNQPTWEGRYLVADVKPPAVNEWGKWDITTLVTEWVNGTYPNYGLYIVNNNEGGYRYDWQIRNRYYDMYYSNDGDDTNNLGTYVEVMYEVEDLPEEPEEPETPTDPYYKIKGSILTGIANEVRRLIGAETKMTPYKIAEELIGVEVGSGGGIEEGYDVTFYDEYGEELAFYSIKQGHSIDAPNYECISWQTTDGVAISFPYVPTADISVYANNDTLASVLYKHFNIDPAVYPYLAVGLWTDRNSCTIIFGKTVTWDYSSLAMRNGYWHSGGAINALEGVDRSDVNAVVSTICQNLTTLTAASEMWGIKNQSNNIWYCNFDPSQFSSVQYDSVGALYRLDEVAETLPYDGLENGYDVMFYDENDEELAFISVKEGKSINPPNYAVKAWEMEDGTIITFPYVPTGDIALYANTDTLAHSIYKHFGIDMYEYPYVAILYYDGPLTNDYITIKFGKSIQTFNANGAIFEYGTYYSQEIAFKPTESITLDYIIKVATEQNMPLSYKEISEQVMLASNYVAVNFDVPETVQGIRKLYRLDD